MSLAATGASGSCPARLGRLCVMAAALSPASAALAQGATAVRQLASPALAVKAGRQRGLSVLEKRRQEEQQRKKYNETDRHLTALRYTISDMVSTWATAYALYTVILSSIAIDVEIEAVYQPKKPFFFSGSAGAAAGGSLVPSRAGGATIFPRAT